MNLTKEQLAELEAFGYVQFNIEKIATVMQLNAVYLKRELDDPGSPAYIAYNKGRHMADFDVRSATFDLAKRGSLQAIIIAKEYTNQLKQDEI